jgi:hypothetical protein
MLKYQENRVENKLEEKSDKKENLNLLLFLSGKTISYLDLQFMLL